MRILILEDDILQFEVLQDNLNVRFPNSQITRIMTAKAFKEEIDRPDAILPDIILIDVLVPWQAVGEPEWPKPPEAVDRKVGIYCAGLVAAHPKTRKIPVIVYTELDRQSRYGKEPSLEEEIRELPKHFHYMRKDASLSDLNHLIWTLTRRKR